MIASCGFILRVIEVTALKPWGLVWFVAGIGLGIAIIAGAVPTFNDILDFNTEAALLYLVIRIFDVLVMVMIVPVVLLYVQNMRADFQESTTFAVISVGVIASLILAYVYEIAKWDSLADIASSEYQTGSLLDALYLFGYFLIPMGLLAHRKHQEWSFSQVQKLLV